MERQIRWRAYEFDLRCQLEFRNGADSVAILNLGAGQSSCGRKTKSKRKRSVGDRGCGGIVWKPQKSRARDSPDGIHDSPEHFHYRPRFPNDLAQAPKLRKGCACVLPMLQRILIATGSARARRAAMHPTPSLSPDGGGHARFAGTRLGPTAPARQHRACVTRMIAGHFFPGAGQEPALAPSGR